MNSSPEMKYDVYISFRGKDTRNFVRHLFDCLHMKKIKTFIGDVLPTGKTFQGMQESRISVIVFSENFGESQWCLNEVVTSMKCKLERFGQIVIPVFYHVDPSDVRNQTGRFGYGFGKLATDQRFKEWRDGLKQASLIQGWSTTGIMRDEEMLVNEIVGDIENKLLRDSRTKVIIEWSVVITNLILEIPSCVLDQISSIHKPSYILAALLLSLLACLISLIDLVHKGITERVVWKTRPIPWFYYGVRRSNMFGIFADMVGLLCGLCQTIVTAINYSSITHKADAPIKFSVWPIFFALGVLFTMYVKKNKTS